MRPMFEAAKRLFGELPVIGVEIGTSAGANAIEVIENWKEISKLYCIDYYPTYSDFILQADQDKLLKCAIINFAPKPKINFRINKSVDAAKEFADNSVDFVYIDANHSYAFVKDDINAWLPKIRKGGIIGGHDYDWTDKEFGDELAVKKAVEEIFGTDGKINYKLSLFTTDGKARSAIKSEQDFGLSVYTGIDSDWWVFL